MPCYAVHSNECYHAPYVGSLLHQASAPLPRKLPIPGVPLLQRAHHCGLSRWCTRPARNAAVHPLTHRANHVRRERLQGPHGRGPCEGLQGEGEGALLGAKREVAARLPPPRLSVAHSPRQTNSCDQILRCLQQQSCTHYMNVLVFFVLMSINLQA